MKFSEVVLQTTAWLERERRISYRALKREFALDDDFLEDLKTEIIHAKRLAIDEDGKVLVWTGHREEQHTGRGERPQLDAHDAASASRAEGERRQLTVMFCDLVGSTALSTQLDPEELRDVVRAYREICAQAISRFDGCVARYLGDGLLVYFGYPVAHEDDVQRAVRAGLGIVAAMREWPLNVGRQQPLQVRIGIHTGLVVAGDIESEGTREALAIVGETPNIAARLQEKAAPDTVVISAVTYRLIQGYFACEDLGLHTLKGIANPLPVYRVLEQSAAQSRFEVVAATGLTPLVGREQEIGLLLGRWQRVKEGEGQVVLLSGEPGIGKSRLVQELKEQVVREGATCIEFRCSPYYQNTAFYPVIERLQRLFRFHHHDSPREKLSKLDAAQWKYRFAGQEAVPLFAALLSLPHPEGYPPLTLSPAKQKEKTLEALSAWLVAEAERTPVLAAWEDLHWADPSTLELHTLLIDQAPTARILTLLTFRPEFSPPWAARAQLAQLSLTRLGREHVEAMVAEMTSSRALPAEVVREIVAKTDGVPLFVEELTKMVIESGLVRPADDHYELAGPLPPLAIPATLQDSLMARLDRLAPIRDVAQLAAVLGREFSYELLHSVSLLDETSLQQALARLVDAEVLYQGGVPPQARYSFKHALIQDAAYQSLLKTKRQQYHSHIARVLEQRFAAITQTQPELLAHHYTEARLIAQAIPYWLKAGQQASQRSANLEATYHLQRALDMLGGLAEGPERDQLEIELLTALGPALIAVRGFSAPAVGRTYERAHELCRRAGDAPQLFTALWGLWFFNSTRGRMQTAREIGEQAIRLAESQPDPGLLMQAHHMLGPTFFALGLQTTARAHLEAAIELYDSAKHRSHAVLYGGHDPGVCCLLIGAHAVWMLGYRDLARRRAAEAIALARELEHPTTLALALSFGSMHYQLHHDPESVREVAEAGLAISNEQQLATYRMMTQFMRGWAIARTGRRGEGLAEMHETRMAMKAAGMAIWVPHFCGMIAELCDEPGQTAAGLAAVTEGLAIADTTGHTYYVAELNRLRGELLLLEHGDGAAEDAEVCFRVACEIARQQEARSLELRAAMSLARLWQRQGKKEEAWKLLAETYNWFTEGFDTRDLQEARLLLEELAAERRSAGDRASAVLTLPKATDAISR